MRRTEQLVCVTALAAFGAVLLTGCGGTSRGDTSVRVPQLVGMKSVNATERIYASGLCLYDIRFGAFNGRNNEVLEQFPRAGASALAGSSVTITVTPAGLSGSIYRVARPAGCAQPLNDPVG